MPKKNSPNTIHIQRMKSIRRFVDFYYKPEFTAYEKRKIKQYFDEINQLTARPNQIYRPRDSKRLWPAQQAAQHSKRLKGLKVAFIPTNGTDKVKVRFNKKGKVTIKGKYVESHLIPLDLNGLIEDVHKEVARAIKDEPSNDFTISAAEHEIPVAVSRDLLAEKVAFLTTKYGATESNHYFGNWLTSVRAHSFDKQVDFGDYLNEKQKQKRLLQKNRRNQKAKGKRAQTAAAKKEAKQKLEAKIEKRIRKEIAANKR